MPDDLVDHWDAPPRRETGRGAVAALGRAVPHVIGAALVAASALLVASQLFSAYRVVWPSYPGQFQFELTDDYVSAKIATLIASPIAVPLISASLPVLVLAGLTRLPTGSGLPIGRGVHLAARVVALVVTLVGLVLFVGAAVWALVTGGQVGSPSDGASSFSIDPMVTFLTRGGDGLAAAVLAGVAGWLLWTTSDGVTATPVAASGVPRALGGEAEGEVDDVGSTTPSPPPEGAESATLSEAADHLGSAVPGSPAPFVTRGATEPSWHQTDPTVFQRPTARSDTELEPVPHDVASADPAAPFRRPVR